MKKSSSEILCVSKCVSKCAPTTSHAYVTNRVIGTFCNFAQNN